MDNQKEQMHQLFNSFLKNSDYLNSVMQAHREGTAEVIGLLLMSLLKDDPSLSTNIAKALTLASNMPGSPSARGDRYRIIELIRQNLQQASSTAHPQSAPRKTSE